MKPNQHRILLRVVLTLAFLVSNLGLPIVLFACPVAERSNMKSSCCPTQNDEHAVGLSSFNSYSCCEKTVVAPPLKFESVELKSTTGAAQKLKMEFGLPEASNIFTGAKPIVLLDAASCYVLVHARESYLLTSSLRI